MPKAEKREQIMQAAEKLFTSRRFHEITVDDIVREAHVGKGAVYRYFTDKDDLFFQVATSGFEEMCDIVRRKAAPADAPFAEQLLHVCVSIGAFFARRRQLFRMIQAEDARMPWRRGKIRERWVAKRKELTLLLAGILRKGVREGLVRADVSSELLATFLLGMLRTRARDSSAEPDGRAGHELVVEIFLHGACRREPLRARGRR